MAPLKVGLMGYGFSTKCFHLPFIVVNKDLEVYAFLQRKEAPEDKSKEGVHCTIDYPKAKHYRTPDEFFGDKEIDLVIVCTQQDTHVEFAERAMKSGKHVVVEKPFTITSAEATQLIKVSQETGKILTVFQNRRYDSDFLTLRSLVEQDAFGKVTEFANHYDIDFPPWAASSALERVPGGGMPYGLGTHSIDQTLLLFGKPESVTAFTRGLREGSKADDAFTIVLQYGGEKNDLICTVKTTIISPLPLSKMLKFMVRGTEGAFVKNGEDPQIDHLFSGLKADDPKFGIEPVDYHGYLSTTKKLDLPLEKSDGPNGGDRYLGNVESKQGSYAAYYKDVVAAIKGEKEVQVKPEESRMGIRVIELARESVVKGVTVKWSEE